jgi:outer membrane protein
MNYLTAKGNTALNILVLKSYMNIDAAAPFEVDTPPVDKIPVEPIASLQPDYVYDLAIKNMPQQRYNDLKMKAAEKSAAAAKGFMYPTLSAYGSLGSNYFVARTPSYTPVFKQFVPSGDIVTISGVPYAVSTPDFTLVKNGYTRSDAFGTQIKDNFKQSIGLSINVPIFNGRSLRSNYERSKLNVNTIQLQKEGDDQKLKQDIYQAYTSALIAYQKFNASQKSIDINELNLSYAQKRFNVGMLGTFDLITTQNNLLRSKLEYVQNQFDYVFKMKVLEFYKGLGLKL